MNNKNVYSTESQNGKVTPTLYTRTITPTLYIGTMCWYQQSIQKNLCFHCTMLVSSPGLELLASIHLYWHFCEFPTIIEYKKNDKSYKQLKRTNEKKKKKKKNIYRFL